jgi:hypothetical protein
MDKVHLIAGLPEPQRSMAIQRGHVIGFHIPSKCLVKHLVVPDSEFYASSYEIPTPAEVTDWIGELRTRGVVNSLDPVPAKTAGRIAEP